MIAAAVEHQHGGGIMFLVNFQWFNILAEAPAGGPANWQEMLLGSPLIPMLATFGVFIWFFTRMDQKKQQAKQKLLADLKKNDAIITVGGVCGTVVNVAADSPYVTIRVDDTNNTRLRILRSAITSIETGEETAGKDAT